MYPFTRKVGSRANPLTPLSIQAPTSSLMSRSKVKLESAGSLNQTRPDTSQTNIRPVLSKVTPSAPFQFPPTGPGTIVSANPGVTVPPEATSAAPHDNTHKRKQTKRRPRAHQAAAT